MREGRGRNGIVLTFEKLKGRGGGGKGGEEGEEWEVRWWDWGEWSECVGDERFGGGRLRIGH